MRLSDLSKNTTATITSVEENQAVTNEVIKATTVTNAPMDMIAHRLKELGFVPGERVRLITTAPFGGDPLLVQIGFTRFALRRSEAARVLVEEITE
ncbi:FeoA family protein [Aquirhabdus parva]|uniref:Ferrous iron transport protein A n=1 Tax=Aquirhabdus parva TaxID=2283318 RepID=A0A345P308_9GAMM|nr:FeoA family protein [Aquirhabdus parva]AXI01667.1 ferrous iron transport protein A [Aquirhabdus parva]